MPFNYIRLSQLIEDIPHFSATCLQWILAKSKQSKWGGSLCKDCNWKTGFKSEAGGSLAKLIGGCDPLESVFRVLALY